MSRSIWATLGVPARSDRDTIRRAYAARLRETNPEDDPEGFKSLRDAYERALQRADVRASRPVDPVVVEGPDADEEPPAAFEPEPATPGASDPELEDLQQRWDALAASLERSWGADASLLHRLLAAPAMERIAVRSDIEHHVARLIAENSPGSDTLLRPAIRAFEWDARSPLARTDFAVQTVLNRARDLADEDAAVPVRRGWFTRVSSWQLLGWRPWLFGAFVAFQVLRLIFANPTSDPKPVEVPPGQMGTLVGAPATPRPAKPVETMPEPSRRGPECGADPLHAKGIRQQPVPCSDTAKWLTINDFSKETLLRSGGRELQIAFRVGRDGYVIDCRLQARSGVPEVDARVCGLITRRAHYHPGRDGAGRAVEWNKSFAWGWSVETRRRAPPPPAMPETAKFEAPAAAAPGLARTCDPAPASAIELGSDAAMLTDRRDPACP